MRKTVMELVKRGVVLMLLFAFGSANAATWYVDAATGSSSHSGKSMSDAFKEIQTAIDKADVDDVIIVNDGIYKPITVGKRMLIRSVGGCDRTFIDGSGEKRCATLYPLYNPYFGDNSVLAGFTLKNGRNADSGGGVRGGELHDCVITNNVGDYGGGANNCTIYNSILCSNRCITNGPMGYGGGAYDCYLFNCVIRDNSAWEGGGAHGCRSHSCEFVNNTATNEGGGIESGWTFNCTVIGNRSPSGGGVCYGNYVNCIIWSNYSGSKISNYEDANKFYYCCTWPAVEGVENLSCDPQLDFLNGHYVLQKSSPCVDKGANLEVISKSLMSSDILGGARIVGRRIDMGSVECQHVQAFPRRKRIWFVDSLTGNDEFKGESKSEPFRTITQGIACAFDGDTLQVAPGVYSPIETFNRPIVIEGVGDVRETIIDGHDSKMCVSTMSGMSHASNCVMRGFTFQHGNGGVSNGYYDRCVFTKNHSSTDGGGASGASLNNCLVYDNVADRHGGGTYCCYVYNCTITKNKAKQGAGCHTNSKTINSIVWGNDGGDFYDTVLWEYSHSCSSSKMIGEGNIVADPLFVDWEQNDFRLSDESPCINTGDNARVVGKHDFEDCPRIKGKTVDMGAFENQTAYPGAEVGYASAQQRYPWNGLVDVQFDVFGMASNEVTNVVLLASGDVMKDLALETFTQGDVSGLTNGTWHCVWDAGADAPRVLDSNLVVKVALPDGDSCLAKATKLDTRSPPRDAAGNEELLVSAAWQDEVPSENVTATLTQTQPGYKATKLAEFTGDAVQKVTWDAANAAVPGVHLFTLTLKENDTGRVLKTMTSSFNVAGGGSEPQPVFTDDPLSIPLEFGSWSALGTFLNDSRAALLRVNGMTAVPPTANVVMISLGEFAVPLSMLSGTAEPVEAIEEYGVRVYHLHVREMGDGTSDLVATVGGVPVTLLSMPPYNPDRWVEALYGMPPAYLTGEERAKWYAERDVARIEWFMTLVPQSDIATYRANRAAALSETVKEQPEIGIGGLTTKTDGETLHSVTVNVKEDSVVDVFGKRTLNETNWTYAGRAFIPAGESAVGVVSDSLSYFMTVVRVAGVAEGGGAVVTEGDSDHDGIPDSVEKMTYGTNPHSADTSGGGIPDWTKIYVYGLNPLVTDTDGDGYDDIEELMSGTDPKVPLPGANTSVRYYYDEDDQLIRVHCGATGAMSATELTPNGNPKTVKERRATK